MQGGCVHTYASTTRHETSSSSCSKQLHKARIGTAWLAPRAQGGGHNAQRHAMLIRRHGARWCAGRQVVCMEKGTKGQQRSTGIPQTCPTWCFQRHMAELEARPRAHRGAAWCPATGDEGHRRATGIDGWCESCRFEAHGR